MATEKDLIISDKKTVADQDLEARTTKIAAAKPFNEELYNATMGGEDEGIEIEDDKKEIVDELGDYFERVFNVK